MAPPLRAESIAAHRSRHNAPGVAVGVAPLNLFTLPGVEQLQIKMLKVFHVSGYERELIMNSHSGDLGVCGCGGLACAIAISHESPP